MSSKSSFFMLDLDDASAAVDCWESSGILSAAEAYEAEKDAIKLKAELEEEKKKREDLAVSAKGRMDEIASLLKSVELSTATRNEMDRLSLLDDEMKRIKEELTESKSAIKSHTQDMLRSMSKSKSYALMKTVKEKDIGNVIRFVEQAETVDLAFLLDCTGSMGGYIESVKSSVKEIVRRVKRTNAGLQLRVAVVAYRDMYTDNSVQHFEVLDFTPSVDSFESFVSGLIASSGIGGDPPEDIAGAVQKACDLSWQQVSRVAFLIADFPCHGIEFHDTYLGDNYPNGTPGVCIKSELKKLLKLGGEPGMQLHFGRITNHTDKMIQVFGDYGVEFETCDLKSPDKLTKSVASSVRKSISKSVTASMSKSKSRTMMEDFEVLDYTIRDTKPSLDEWRMIKPQAVKVLCNKPVTSINDLKATLSIGFVRLTKSTSELEETTMAMLRAKNPFAEGEMRVAYYGKIGTGDLLTAGGVDDKVFKTFKKTKKSSSDDRKRYLAQMEVSTIASFLAKEYNKSRPEHCQMIRFLEAWVVERDGYDKERYCVEDQLPGAATGFTKFSNNTGYWNEDEINQSLLLFTKFTYEKTGGYMMVTDLQGVRHGNEYILTDPAILCKDSIRFGETNLGKKIMDKCMKATDAMMEEYGWDD